MKLFRLLPLIFIFACNQSAKRIDAYIDSIPILPTVKDELSFDHTSGIETKVIDGANYSCVTQSGETSKNLEEFIAFNPSINVLFPGNVIHGSSLNDGLLTQLNVERSGGTLIIHGVTFKDSLLNIAEKQNQALTKSKSAFVGSSFLQGSQVTEKRPTSYSNSKQLDQITPSAVYQAISDLKNRIPDGKQVSRIFFEKQEFHSAQTDFLKLGASYKWSTGKVSAAFSSFKDEKTSKYIVKVTQIYYDISFDIPINGARRPSDYFRNVKFSAFKKILDNYMNTHSDSIDPPCYIQSVTYGRILYLIAESNESQDSLNVTMNAAFSGGMTSGSLDLSAGRTAIFQNSKMTVFSLGGAAEATVNVINGGTNHLMDSLKVYLQEGANYSKNSPAYPISFVAKYLKTDDVAKLGVTYKYNVPICTKNPRQVKTIKFNFITTTDDKDHEEGVFASVTKDGNLIASAGPWGYAVEWRENSGPYSFEIPVANINEVELNNVRLVVRKSSECGGGDGWGCGWHFVLNISVVFDDNSEKQMSTYPACMMGNGSSGIQAFPIIQ